ncbi:hypothetical protein F4604DRAFT_1677715 [Suillus subluteus]|nr:hypothetical protein F4604DRAFT_1677715 [Suillus subluteus]
MRTTKIHTETQGHDRSRDWSEDTGGGVDFNEGGSAGVLIDEEIPLTGDFIDWFRRASQSYGAAVHRARNLYYPFSGRKDWELASWLLRSGLSMGKIDSFLSLEMLSLTKRTVKIQGLPLSFSSGQGTARQSRNAAEWSMLDVSSDQD